MKEKISIIIPVYNAEKKLPSTVRSVRNQTYTNLEIIFVNDCSTDRSLQYLEKEASFDRRIVIINNPTNERALRARWIGAQKSTGDYVFFLDADDELPMDAMTFLIERAQRDNADIVLGSIITLVDRFGIIKGNPFNVVGKKPIDITYFKDEINSNFHLAFFGTHSIPVSSWAKLISNKIIKKFLTYDPPKIHLFDDVYLNLILFEHATKISFIKNVVYYYKYGGVTSTFDSRLLNDIDEVHQFRKLFIKEEFRKTAEKSLFIELKNTIEAYFLNSILIGNYNKKEFIQLVHKLQELNIYKDMKEYFKGVESDSCFIRDLLLDDMENAYNSLKKTHNKIKFKRLFRRKIAQILANI